MVSHSVSDAVVVHSSPEYAEYLSDLDRLTPKVPSGGWLGSSNNVNVHGLLWHFFQMHCYRLWLGSVTVMFLKKSRWIGEQPKAKIELLLGHWAGHFLIDCVKKWRESWPKIPLTWLLAARLTWSKNWTAFHDHFMHTWAGLALKWWDLFMSLIIFHRFASI